MIKVWSTHSSRDTVVFQKAWHCAQENLSWIPPCKPESREICYCCQEGDKRCSWPTGELDTAKLVKGSLQLRITSDPDRLSPTKILLGRQLRDLRDFIPAKPKPHITSSEHFQEVWKLVADWRELVLAPRSANLHDRLSQHTEELPPLEVGDCVLIQNLLGNHPKR